MQFTAIFRILGLLFMLLSLTLIPPVLVEQWYQDGNVLTFHISFAITLLLGFCLWYPFRQSKHFLRTHDGFFIVVLFWLAASLVGAFPFYFSIVPRISFTNAFFEAMSGITTTGSTIFAQLDYLPHSLLYYRQQLQFIGGMSIILLAVAILPTLGIGGMQLFRTEISGPVKDDKLTPRITHTAKAMWGIYLVMTFLCALCYWVAGMSFFDAIAHSFSTVSTGGFSTHNDGLCFFNSPYIKIVTIVFMLIGAISFHLHFLTYKHKKLKFYIQDPECRFFIGVVLLSVFTIWATIAVLNIPSESTHPLLDTIFQVASFITTTGFTINDFPLYHFIPMLLLFLGVMGGCAGSTSGGVKMVRVLLLQKQATREIRRLVHPHGQYLIKLGTKPISGRVVESIWGFFAMYFVIFFVLLLLLLAFENDFHTSYCALLSSLSNIGASFAGVTYNYASLSTPAKWICSFAMLVGRLEIFTLLVLFSPTFWRR